IKTGGYKVYPDEIEAALAATPGCGDICVVALHSDYCGETIVAVADRAEGIWRNHSRQQIESLARDEHPRAHLGVAALPRNPQGKISRHAVRDLILSEYVLHDGPYPTLQKR